MKIKISLIPEDVYYILKLSVSRKMILEGLNPYLNLNLKKDNQALIIY